MYCVVFYRGAQKTQCSNESPGQRRGPAHRVLRGGAQTTAAAAAATGEAGQTILPISALNPLTQQHLYIPFNISYLSSQPINIYTTSIQRLYTYQHHLSELSTNYYSNNVMISVNIITINAPIYSI